MTEDNIDRSFIQRQTIRDVERILKDMSENAKRNGYPDPVVKTPYITFSYNNKPVELTVEEAELIHKMLFTPIFSPIFSPSRPEPRLVSLNETIKPNKSTADLKLI